MVGHETRGMVKLHGLLYEVVTKISHLDVFNDPMKRHCGCKSSAEDQWERDILGGPLWEAWPQSTGQLNWRYDMGGAKIVIWVSATPSKDWHGQFQNNTPKQTGKSIKNCRPFLSSQVSGLFTAFICLLASFVCWALNYEPNYRWDCIVHIRILTAGLSEFFSESDDFMTDKQCRYYE